MVNDLPPISDTGRYGHSETARILGIDRKTLKSHADEGRIKRRYRRCNNRPFYLGKDIKSYWKGEY